MVVVVMTRRISDGGVRASIVPAPNMGRVTNTPIPGHRRAAPCWCLQITLHLFGKYNDDQLLS